jgi:DNA-binding NtrC family response regulator
MENLGKRILVIEDEEPLLDLYSEVFSRKGHRVDVAENGRIGFRKGVTTDYDIIVCDLHMPEWNGVEAIKSILLVKPTCLFVVVTGYADKKIADELQAIPEVLKVFSKPADMHSLLACISSAGAPQPRSAG